MKAKRPTPQTSKGSPRRRPVGRRSTAEESRDLHQPHYPGVYFAGALSALIIVLIFLVEMIVVVAKGFPPTSIEERFLVFQKGRAIGLLRTFALDVVAVSLHVPLYLVLFYILRENRERYGLLVTAIILALIGVAVYLATNTTFSILWLSDKYSAATTEAQKAKLLGAGEAALSIYNGTGPFAAYALYSIAGIIVSVVMLRGTTFGKAAAIVGIVGNALELGLPPSINPSFFMKVDPFLIAIGGVFIIIWYVLIAIRLIKERNAFAGKVVR